MMERNKVLPRLSILELDQVVDPEHCYRVQLGRLGMEEVEKAVEAQRNADWEVLQERERKYQVLVGALKAILHSQEDCLPDFATFCMERAQEALVQLEEKK